jgi:hypothetical protein
MRTLSDGKRLWKAPAGRLQIHGATISPDGRWVAFCFADKIGIRDAETGDLVRSISASLTVPTQP